MTTSSTSGDQRSTNEPPTESNQRPTSRARSAPVVAGLFTLAFVVLYRVVAGTRPAIAAVTAAYLLALAGLWLLSKLMGRAAGSSK